MPRSTSGYAVFLVGNLVSWSSKWQNIIFHSSVEAEYMAVANAIAKVSWLQELPQEHTKHIEINALAHDNMSVVYLSSNPVQH